jgi:heme exporter protein D
MTHAGYILAAYLVTALVLLAMIGWVALDLRAQKNRLARLEGQGLRRRSEPPR